MADVSSSSELKVGEPTHVKNCAITMDNRAELHMRGNVQTNLAQGFHNDWTSQCH